jgi:hypothetical protein
MRGHTEIDVPANPDKIELVLKAFKDNDVKTFADLGACWGVNGAYTNAALLSFKIARAYVVDTHPTNISRERLAPFGKKVKFLQGEFGYPEVYNKISEIDAVLLFDVLLHQANPDWNDILSIYAKKLFRTKDIAIDRPRRKELCADSTKAACGAGPRVAQVSPSDL